MPSSVDAGARSLDEHRELAPDDDLMRDLMEGRPAGCLAGLGVPMEGMMEEVERS